MSRCIMDQSDQSPAARYAANRITAVIPRASSRRYAFLPRNPLSHLPPCHLRTPARLGVTLIELLIVVALLLMLLGIAVPLIKPALDRGRVREAARQVNTFFAAAQARATELGRPAGVWLERSAGDGNACFDLFPAELPPIYSGDFPGAKARCEFANGRWLVAFDGSETMLLGQAPLIRPTERFFVRFDYKGPLYPIVRGPAENPLLADASLVGLLPGLVPPLAAQVSDAMPSDGVPFQVYRSPTKTTGRALQLAGGAVVDLQNSGLGPIGTQFQSTGLDDRSPVTIMFAPGGAVDRVSYSKVIVRGGQPFFSILNDPPIAPIHLLVGRLDGVDPVSTLRRSAIHAEDDEVPFNENLVNTESVWITLGHRTGLISTSENAWLLAPVAEPTFQGSLEVAREFARTAQILGGR